MARRLLGLDLASRNQLASVSATKLAHVQDLIERVGGQSVWREALGAAERARELALPDRLSGFRAADQLYAARLAASGSIAHWREPAFLSALGETAAFAEMLAASARASTELLATGRDMLLSPVPALGSLAEYRRFLDGAGLTLPRMPRVRIVSAAEKRRRIKGKLKRNAAPPHVKRARTLVHQYELTLRDSIDAAMAAEYGDDWALDRLEACGCRDLLGRWRKRGGDALDHADYAHYERIMDDPDHYAEVFAGAFEDPDAMRELIARAGRLRAASHHARAFSLEDLRELRLTWRTIELGLAALIDDIEIESWG